MAALLIAPVDVLRAGPPEGSPSGVTGTVEGEVARRQAQVLEAERLIAEGDQLSATEDFAAAVDAYARAYNSLTPSPLAQDTLELARLRYSAASVRSALQMIDKAEFASAEALIDRVLDPAVNPTYEPAKTVKARLQDPEWYNKARSPEHHANVEKVEELLVLGKGAMDIADFDLALNYFTQVLRIDKYNVAARRGMTEAENAIARYANAARDHTREHMLRKVDAAWETEVEISGAFGLGDGLSTSINVEADSISDKLKSIILDQVNFDEATLEEVVELLKLRSRQADPSGDGINFVLQLDPADQALQDARITLNLRGVPLGEVLRYVTRQTGTNYSVDGYVVKVESASLGDGAMATKKYRVPPDFLTNTTVGGGEAAAEDPFATPEADSGRGLNLKRLSAREFLEQQGVTFPAGASATYVASSSTLIVRNTQNNLNIIEGIVDSSFGQVSKQVEIHVTVIDITQNELNELGFDWLLGHFNVPGSNRVFAGGGTFGNVASTGSAAEAGNDFTFIPPGGGNPLGQFPITAGLRSGKQWNEGDAISNILLGNGQAAVSSLKAPGVFAVGGALTDPQFQFVIRALSQSKSGDIMTKPSTVTRSGQRATIDIVKEFPYPTEYDPPEIPQNQGGFGGDGLFSGLPSSGNSFPVTPAHPTAFEVRNVGTHLEVEPVIGADNYTVELNLTPEVVRFEGFINYGSPITTASNDVFGNPITVPLTENRILQPVFKTLRQSTSVAVWDGAIVVIGGLIEDRAQKINDKVPVFGDMPFFGRLFRSTGEDRLQRAVLFFVQANVIDPSGRRVNAR